MNTLATMLDPSALSVASWLACAFFVVAGWNQVDKFLDHRKDTPPAGDVRAEAADKYVPKADCLARHQALEAQLRQLGQQRIDDAKDGGASRQRIYGEIEHVRKEMAELERRLNAADEARTLEIHKRLNDILEAVGELRGKLTRE